MGHPERHFPSIHVGGTNGKGSVAVLVYETLRAAGFSTALYTSPHLVDVRERMIVDGRPISREAFAMWTDRMEAAILEEQASFFEATTAMAFADFAARGADVAVIEVGLGGRLDSTNVLDPVVSAVTYVGLEHTEYLGDTLDQIAREKAGIAKPGRPFVVGEPDPGRAALMVELGRGVGAEVVIVPPEARYEGALVLQGKHQRRNAAVAGAVLAALPEAFRPSDDDRRRAFARARLPGRFDRRGTWIFDVAHNADGMEVLVETLRETAPPRPIHALVSVLADKDWTAMLERLSAAADRVWATTAPTAPPPRRWDLGTVAHRFSGRVTVEPDFDRALQDVREGARTVVVCGSFHTVGDAMARLPGLAPLG